jgi:hypothetical protein
VVVQRVRLPVKGQDERQKRREVGYAPFVDQLQKQVHLVIVGKLGHFLFDKTLNYFIFRRVHMNSQDEDGFVKSLFDDTNNIIIKCWPVILVVVVILYWAS